MDTVPVSTLVATACLIAIGYVVGLSTGRARRRGARFGLLNKPRKSNPTVLVPPGPTPRLIPSDSPKATRATLTGTPIRRQTPAGASRAGMIDYIAAFADSEKSRETRVDYLLMPDDSTETSHGLHCRQPPGRGMVEIVNVAGSSPVVLLCEHASNFIPPEYQSLGLSSAELERHIAWDIGAAGVTRELAQLLDAPAFLSQYSRLLIDLNRPLASPTSIVTRSEHTDIPGNASIDAAEREQRVTRYFEPFHQAVERLLEERRRAQRPALIVAIHSFTPTYHGEARPWEAGIIYDKGAAFAEATLDRLRLHDTALNVGANVPYSVAPEDYYGLLVYGDYADRPAILVEIRQDLLLRPEQQANWARRLAAALAIDVGLQSIEAGMNTVTTVAPTRAHRT